MTIFSKTMPLMGNMVRTNPEEQPSEEFFDEIKTKKQIIQETLIKVKSMSYEEFGRFIRKFSNSDDFIKENFDNMDIEEIEFFMGL